MGLGIEVIAYDNQPFHGEMAGFLLIFIYSWKVAASDSLLCCSAAFMYSDYSGSTWIYSENLFW